MINEKYLRWFQLWKGISILSSFPRLAWAKPQGGEDWKRESNFLLADISPKRNWIPAFLLRQGFGGQVAGMTAFFGSFFLTRTSLAQIGEAAMIHHVSIWGLFMQADWIVKVVMLMLLAASVWCWAIIIDKVLHLRRLKAAATFFEEHFWSGGSLDALYDKLGKRPIDPMTATFAAGMREWKHASDRAGAGGVKTTLQQRVERVMHVTAGREMSAVEKQMTVLASVGSVSPFVGLFGTVWGIMNSFTSIASTNNTSLAVVAPGIAEALFATALGLVAAIPAVLAYNKFSNDINKYGDRLDAFVAEFSAILSRYSERA